RVGRELAGEDAQQGGLAAAVLAEQTGGAPGGHHEADVGENAAAGEGEGDPVGPQMQGGVSGGGPGPGGRRGGAEGARRRGGAGGGRGGGAGMRRYGSAPRRARWCAGSVVGGADHRSMRPP